MKKSKMHPSVKHVVDEENRFDGLRRKFRKEFVTLCIGIMVIAVLTGIANHFMLRAIGAL